MAARKRSRSDTEHASRLCSADDDSSNASENDPELAVAHKRARKSAPIQKIINVVELCEQVLSHLPMYDLLHAMQVCRTFKTTIEDSHVLRKTLFLIPDLPRPRLAMSPHGTLLSGIRAEQQIAAAEAAGERETGEFTCCTLHPALQLDPDSHRILAYVKKHKGMVDYAADRFHPSRIFTTDDMVVRDSVLSSTENGSKPSSLNNMSIAQPPVMSVVIVIPGFGGHFCDLANETMGMTFGDVFKTIARIAARYPYRDCSKWWLSLDRRVFVVSAEARDAAKRAGELSAEEDPTRWVLENGRYVLQEGGFEFV